LLNEGSLTGIGIVVTIVFVTYQLCKRHRPIRRNNRPILIIGTIGQ